MLRPERMSRVSVTGSKRVMDDVIETVHDLHLLHVNDYDGDWPGFEPGDPIQGADATAEKLVTVRALESTLGVTEADAGPGEQVVTDEALDEQLEAVRQEVNELDDRRNEVRDELRSVEDDIDTMEPFVRLGIDLDLLQGYDTLAVAVGEGDPEGVRDTLAESDLDAYEVFENEGVVAVAAQADEGTLQDELVNAPFAAIEVPDGEGDPEAYLSELRHRKQQLEAKLSTVEEELEACRVDYGAFLLAAEEQLTIEVDKLEAPLSFATTANAFISEGWIPSERYDEFEAALQETVGDHVEVTELERASYDEHGHVHEHEDLTEDEEAGAGAAGSATAATAAGEAAAGDGEADDEEVAADGGTVTMGDDEPPVVQDNPGAVKPFEALVEVINRPKYTEFDPTVVLFLTFPLFFGFMIGDVGYGLLYLALGGWLATSFDSDVIRSLGGVTLWAGGFTVVFGVLYGEIFGLHVLGDVVWGGHPPLHKGLSPADVEWAQAWLLISILAGIAHVGLGHVIAFAKHLSHGLKEAVMESGSWVIMLGGLWVWLLSTHAASKKPSFMVGAESVFNGNPVALGFTGFPETVGLVALGLFFLGLVMIALADFVEFIEAVFLKVLVDGLSYTRLAAVLLAKAGMAFVVNLLFFGAYNHHGEFHFMMGTTRADVIAKYGAEEVEIMFGGLVHAGITGVLVGLVILVVGHLLVLALGITSAGLQAVRLEYVEFFGKFYEGGGRQYLPFGQTREYTAD